MYGNVMTMLLRRGVLAMSCLRLSAVRERPCISTISQRISCLGKGRNSSQKANLLYKSPPNRAPSRPGRNEMTKQLYPERLMVYHTKSLESATIGMIKLTPIILFAFGCLGVAPRFYFSPDYSNWFVPLSMYPNQRDVSRARAGG